ncbi:MAG: hypothetical protein K2X81_01225 [Candidatus Obscuribacterales bacterium]|nr:hypothetical protein [Candidatus Obscuribacterales bacterium]
MFNRHVLFFSQLEDIRVIDPAKTEFVFDESRSFVVSCLFKEARLRQAALQYAIAPGVQIA